MEGCLDRLLKLLLPLAAEAALTAEGEEAVAPVRLTERMAVGVDLDASVRPETIREATRFVDEAGFSIDAVTGVDWPEQQQMELVYDFMHFALGFRVVLRARVARDAATIDSIADIFPGANWHERETAEFFGIQFQGHPNLINLLLPEDFEGYPLRKDFQPPAPTPV